MNIEAFWQRVDAARAAAGENTEDRPAELHAQLSGLSAEELESFQQHYDELLNRSFRWDLWAAAYIINGGCSDDGFRYFRDWLISEGRATFEAALAAPESLAGLPHVGDAELESFGYVALELYEETDATGRMPRIPSNERHGPAGAEWKEDEVDDLFPRLAAKYG